MLDAGRRDEFNRIGDRPLTRTKVLTYFVAPTLEVIAPRSACGRWYGKLPGNYRAKVGDVLIEAKAKTRQHMTGFWSRIDQSEAKTAVIPPYLILLGVAVGCSCQFFIHTCQVILYNTGVVDTCYLMVLFILFFDVIISLFFLATSGQTHHPPRSNAPSTSYFYLVNVLTRGIDRLLKRLQCLRITQSPCRLLD